MNVNELKDSYKNMNVLYNAAPSGSIYNQQIKFGGFLSLSYTIFNIKSTGNPNKIGATTSTSNITAN
ncbi:hypothetical protein [Chitinophaga eiseniae]|uniref:Uncharacterized protein n=1 Tax=Chitinophaga eiseniae TaxID=634771 RepID=A0A847SW41_9BACT|nr:hypothetical protein [Chitinophaga eiseniae]NLR82506.1 hypothetical protein [Chitinophaga eiseniae]